MSRWGQPLVVVWQTFDSSVDAAAGHCFLVPLFGDGFESGDTSA